MECDTRLCEGCFEYLVRWDDSDRVSSGGILIAFLSRGRSICTPILAAVFTRLCSYGECK